MGYIEPLEDPEPGEKVRFENRMIGNAIPPGYITAVEKGFMDACNSGTLIGHPVEVALSSLSLFILTFINLSSLEQGGAACLLCGKRKRQHFSICRQIGLLVKRVFCYSILALAVGRNC